MKLGRQWDSRLQIWDEAFEANLYQPIHEIEVDGFTTMEHLTLEQARSGSFRPFMTGESWGKKWEYGWFHCTICIPEEAEGKRILLHLGTAEEMLVFVNGKEAGSIDRKHLYIEVTDCAIPGREFEIYAECYAGHGVRREDGGIQPRDAVPVPEPSKAQCRIRPSHFGIWNQAMFEAYADYHTLYDLFLQLPASSLRSMEIAEGLKKFTYIADFELDEPERTRSVTEAARVLAPLLARKNGDTVPEYTVFGQSHLDLVWLWPLAETDRKCARTYANQLAMMDRYPDYRFLLCCPTILMTLKKQYPDLYRRVREKTASGQFIPEGSVWVESDTNLPSGESLIRQFVWGKRFFAQEFDTDTKIAWLPDCFGFSGALPQIMEGCRVPYFATQKLLRSDPECEPFPYNNFWWEGIDGTRTLSHIFFDYNAPFTPMQLTKRWEKDRRQPDHVNGLIFPFGYGDGGGGATEIMMETYHRCQDLEGLPRCRMKSPVRYFERLEDVGESSVGQKNPEIICNTGAVSKHATEKVPEVYYGELYLAWHRGTYTVVSEIKQKLREAEFALREAEYLAGLLRLDGKLREQTAVPPCQTTEEGHRETVKKGSSHIAPDSSGKSVLEQIHALWEELLLQDFHDAAAGSSIHRVNQEVIAALEHVTASSRALAEELLTELADGESAVFNSLSWGRSVHGTALPPCGYVLLESRPQSMTDSQDTSATKEGTVASQSQTMCEAESEKLWKIEMGADQVIIRTSYYRATLDHCGRIVSLKDAKSDYEYADTPLNDLRMYQDINHYYDAWEISRMYEQIPEPFTAKPDFFFLEGASQAEAVSGNPTVAEDTCDTKNTSSKNAVAMIERKEAHFTFRQRIHFSAAKLEIVFETEIDWHERHRILKVDFPTTIFTREVLEEIQFGYMKRPTHRSRQYEKDQYETCHHKYAALTDGANGLALINNTRYGLSARDSCISLTLLRAPAVPDMTSDEGLHRFRYVLLPFRGPFQYSEVPKVGYEYNTPVTATKAAELLLQSDRTKQGVDITCTSSRSFFSIEGAEVFLETCKPAMDVPNGVVLRLYEPMGMAGDCRLHLPAQVKQVWRCNMLEEKQEVLLLADQTVQLHFGAFKILTLLLEM